MDDKEKVKCPYCGCRLSVDDHGEPIAHDHIDDSPSSLENRPRSDY